MKDKIIAALNTIVEKEDITIHYACESGSRAWGFPSKDSDYDVRFIYTRKKDWYLQVDEGRDVIEEPISELLDINGWDLKKALKLLRKSNPPLLEWLYSPIIYKEDQTFTRAFKGLADDAFSPIRSTFHYLHMAKGNYRDYLQQDQVRVKKYFYVLRPILAALWLQEHNSIPPLSFETLADRMLKDLQIKREISLLLARKKAGDELDFEPRVSLLNDFIEDSIQKIESRITETPSLDKDHFTERMNSLFLSTLNRH